MSGKATKGERGLSPFLRVTYSPSRAVVGNHRALCSLWLHSQSRDNGMGHTMSFSSHERPPGNLLLKEITELRCGPASPLQTLCSHTSLSGLSLFNASAAQGQSKYNTWPFHQVDRLNVSSVWSSEKQTKSIPAALTLDFNIVLRANPSPRAPLTTDCCLSRDYSRYNTTARVIYVVPPN